MGYSRNYPYRSYQVPIQQFYGGQSFDEAIGTPASFSYSMALEHRRNPSQLTVLPGPRKIAVLPDLALNLIQTKSGDRYSYGEQGNIHKINSSNVGIYVSKLPTGSDGALYRSDSDACYFATQTDLRRYYPMSGTPTFDVTYGPSKSIDTAAYRTGGASTYTVPLTIDEGQYCSFQPDIEPFYSNKVNVITKGTGDVTLTLHDGLNNVLGFVTVTAANMTNGLLEFLYSSQIRALVKPNARTYHFHLTSTVADTTVACATTSQLNTADFELWAYRLVDTVNNLHPMAQFQQFTLIGNGNYLAVWEPLTDNNPPNNEFLRHRLTFPSGYEVCGIAVTDEFAVIACEKYSTNNGKDFQEGKLFIWDGAAQTYNQVVDVAGGSPGGIQSYLNYPYFIVHGTLYAWPGGKEIVPVRTIANTATAYSNVLDSTRVYPNMLCVHDNLLHIGFPSVTTNPAIEHGVYIWGTLDKNFKPSFNYGYVPANQNILNTSGNLRLGCVRSFGDEMYMSVQYADGSYGLEIVDSFCTPAPVFKFRTRRFDGGQVYRDKQAERMSITTAPIPAGVVIMPVCRINAGADVTYDPMKTGDESIVSVITSPRTFKRIVIGFNGTCSGSSSPIIYCDTLQYNPLIDRTAL